LRSRPATRDAARRRPGGWHRPAGDAADQYDDDPGCDPVPATATRKAHLAAVRQRSRDTLALRWRTAAKRRNVCWRLRMYKLLLCWRYLLTRYLALACIISVMLGVATLIVVNSVMGGFSSKLRERLHNTISDLVIEAPSMEGFGNYRGMMERIR